MAKSKLIKDFTESTLGIDTILKKLIVLLDSFNDIELKNWARHELSGYTKADKLPYYRKVRGVVLGSYTLGPASALMVNKNTTLPIAHLPEDIYNSLTQMKIYQSAKTLASVKEDDNQLMLPIDPNYFSLIQKGSNINIIDAYIFVDIGTISDIIAKINDKILEVLLYLDSTFGNLDDLDIDYLRECLGE